MVDLPNPLLWYQTLYKLTVTKTHWCLTIMA